MLGHGALELWGGLECTVARIGDRVRDQVCETGHHGRLEDLDRVAALGIRTLRYPIVWERTAPESPSRRDWGWQDARMARLRALGIRPIAGLVHHGSGPFYTDLLSRDFPRLLARHAERVARRYPWIDLYTPVNEPLTTARFSCLYGHWYPHARSYGKFLFALVNQCRATVLAMRAIRRVNPSAQLVQTDDFGRAFSTPHLAHQAEHENERRWLTFDLLFGRVDRRHPWWRILTDHGISERDLAIFKDGDARPDIVGINHYLTSERYLDERLARYPGHLAGGNGREAYADVEAVRVRVEPGQLGPGPRLREVWERYRTPIAVTEVHHGCTRDEQLRWLAEVWGAADAERRAGADIRAVTAWALFGTVDWNSLLTREAGIYEPGAFDTRGPAPRPTAIAAAVGALARTGTFDHPVLDQAGWWRRDTRFYRPKAGGAGVTAAAPPRAILVIGPDNPLRRALHRLAAGRGLALAAAESLTGDERELDSGRIWAVIDTGADQGRGGSSGRGRWRPTQAARLAAACHETGRPFVTISPRANALSAAQADVREGLLSRLAPNALAIRTGPLFAPWERDDVVAPMLVDVAARRPIHAEPGSLSLTYLPDLVHVALDLLVDAERGVWRLANPPALSLVDVARTLVEKVGAGAHPVLVADRPEPLSAPPRTGSTQPEALRGELMPPMAGALDRYLRDLEFDWRQPAGVLPAAAE